MMKTIRFLLLALLLSACSQTNPQPQSKVLGLLEVHFSLDGQAEAQFLSKGVSAQTNTVVTDVGLNFSRRFVNFYDDDAATSPTRYISSVFNITNTTARAFSNLTLYAINVPGTTIGGTTIVNMRTADDVAITSTSVAQGMKPTHGMRPNLTSVEVDPNRADLHFINQTEASTVQSGATGLSPAIVGEVLQYGFVARNLSGGRSIGASGCAPTGCNQATVTFAFKMPRITPRKDNPWAFTLYFVVADESSTFISQSPEEQASNSPFAARLTTLSGAQARTVAGSTYSGTQTHFCQVRTAGTNATPLANLIPQTLVEVDGACGNNPNMLAAVNNARAIARTCGTTNFPAAPPVMWNQQLARAAINYSRDMAANNTFTPPTGLGTQISNAGFNGGWTGWFSSGNANAQSVVNFLLSASSVCATIMDPGWTYLGMAGESSTPGGTLWWTFILGG